MLDLHPAVNKVAVVAQLNEYWRETPCTFESLNYGRTEKEIIDFCKEKLQKHVNF